MVFGLPIGPVPHLRPPWRDLLGHPTFGSRVTDAGQHHLAWVGVAIGVASLMLTLSDRHLPTTVREPASGPAPRPAPAPPDPRTEIR